MAPEDPPGHPTSMSGTASLPSGQGDLTQFFVVDSYNIHRLVIAGVTCASKFFSDVFYTNSRYAKVSSFSTTMCSRLIEMQVGGLPLAELNHLELQFLLLNDFRLSIPVEELEAYGTMLVEFYAREVVVQQQHAAQQHAQHVASSQGGADEVYMRDRSAAPSAHPATPSWTSGYWISWH
jgi:PHO85 cyclin-6/7